MNEHTEFTAEVTARHRRPDRPAAYAGRSSPPRLVWGVTAAAAVTAMIATVSASTPAAAAPTSLARPLPAAAPERFPGSPRDQALPAEVVERQLARLAQRSVDAGAPGVIVRVDDGRRVTSLVRQSPQSRSDRGLGSHDAFRVGSNTKTMVATLVLQQVAERRLRLDDPVEKWLPGVIPNGRAITLKMLLNHTSGLFDYLYDPAALLAVTGQDTRQWTPRQLIAAGVAHDPSFAPGRGWSYSNTNYIALGLVLEKATGTSLTALIDARIVRPLGLRHTYLDTSVRSGDRRLAHGYEPSAEHLAPLLPEGTPPGTAFAGEPRGDRVDTTWNNISWAWAAGGMVSTAADWARFDTALLSGKLLPAAQLKQMRVTVDEGAPAPNRERYGLGLMRVRTSCGTVWGHTGGVPGFSSVHYATSDGRRTVSVYTTTLFALHAPEAAAADQALVDGAVCAMLGKPLASASRATGS